MHHRSLGPSISFKPLPHNLHRKIKNIVYPAPYDSLRIASLTIANAVDHMFGSGNDDQ